jgi:predicted TPR repeat methyltransferase
MSAGSPLVEQAMSALQAGNWGKSEVLCRQALREKPTSAEALFTLARIHSERGDDWEGIRLTQAAICYGPQYVPPYRTLAATYYAMGRHAEAAEIYRAWSHIEPNSPEVRHMLAATTGENTPTRCSDDYVHSHFNAFADRFDSVLVKRLRYRGPEVIAQALATHAGTPEAKLDVLDAGCGTGLCGLTIRPWCRRLVGVDLADKMVERARQRGCYDELAVAELSAFMSSRPGAFDVIVSADVLIYFGALGAPIQAAFEALRPHGLLVVTVEALADNGTDPFKLEESGRYAHRDTYLREVLGAAKLDVLRIEQDSLRWEGGSKVPFYTVVARKAASTK